VLVGDLRRLTERQVLVEIGDEVVVDLQLRQAGDQRQRAETEQENHPRPPPQEQIGQPADDPDILKGKAGSFYAIKDYFDVSPDYALDPANRLAEFESLVGRIHDADLKVVIDFVPNHVARTYESDIRPELSFGADDDTSVFFSPQNNFFYLVDPPGQSLSIPEPAHWPRPAGADGTIERENNNGTPEGDVPKVTGNDVTTAEVSVNAWYETIKLNYGYDFTTGEGHYQPIPDTWKKMDEILAYWQELGVDGFRCDFAHLVPIEAWEYLIRRAKERDPDAFFFAEAYEGAGGPPGFSFSNFVQVGFDAVYDDGSYDTLKAVYCCGKWANDIDERIPGDFMFSKYLRYIENHDERRIASPLVEGQNPDDSGFGSMEAGKPAAGLLYLLGDGPILVFNGQEVGEEAAGSEGFSGDDGRTTIFDYWTMPHVAEWVNGYEFDGGGLDASRKELRSFYRELIALAQKPGFASGNFYGLQSLNKDNPDYTSGQWIYSFLRYDTDFDAVWLVVANFSDQAHEFGLKIPAEAAQFAGFDGAGEVEFVDALAGGTADGEAIVAEVDRLDVEGVPVELGAYELAVFEVTWDK
jgi:glycosidase